MEELWENVKKDLCLICFLATPRVQQSIDWVGPYAVVLVVGKNT